MTSSFKNFTGEATPTGLTLYTVPANTSAVIIGLNLANKGTAQTAATVRLGTQYIIKDVPLPVGSAFSPLDGKIIMTAGQTLTVTATDASSVDAILSVLEQA